MTRSNDAMNQAGGAAGISGGGEIAMLWLHICHLVAPARGYKDSLTVTPPLPLPAATNTTSICKDFSAQLLIRAATVGIKYWL